jgi:hypothetical protein
MGACAAAGGVAGACCLFNQPKSTDRVDRLGRLDVDGAHASCKVLAKLSHIRYAARVAKRAVVRSS